MGSLEIRAFLLQLAVVGVNGVELKIEILAQEQARNIKNAMATKSEFR